MITDNEILATVDKSKMFDQRLQLAHDKMLLCKTSPETKEYADKWHEYLAAGGDRTMRDKGIDLDNWLKHRAP